MTKLNCDKLKFSCGKFNEFQKITKIFYQTTKPNCHVIVVFLCNIKVELEIAKQSCQIKELNCHVTIECQKFTKSFYYQMTKISSHVTS